MRLIFVSVAICFLSCFRVYAASYEYDMQKCKEIMQKNPADIKVLYNFGKLEYDFSKSSEELAGILKSETQISGKLNGITTFAPHIKIEGLSAVADLSEERKCIYPGNVVVTIWYEPTVYIANHLEKDSCRYNVTIRHEQTHLDIGHYLLLMFAGALKKQLPNISANISPIVESDARMFKKINNKILENYWKQTQSIFTLFQRALIQTNQKLDTKDNYAKEDELCEL